MTISAPTVPREGCHVDGAEDSEFHCSVRKTRGVPPALLMEGLGDPVVTIFFYRILGRWPIDVDVGAVLRIAMYY